MWISGYVTGNSFGSGRADIGEVRATGERVSVSASDTLHKLPIVAPYGIVYVPPVGERSMVLPCGAGHACMGVIAPPPEGLESGELMLYSSGGARIVLKNDGRVLINGRAVE